MRKQIRPRLEPDDILRPNWQWLDRIPDDDPILADIKRKNATENCRVAVFMWVDESIARMTCIGWPELPIVDDDAITTLYAIGRAHMERLEEEESRK